MNQTYFQELASYNRWANHIVSSWLGKLTEEQWKETVVSSFNSVEATTIHVIGVEKIWLERLQLMPHTQWLPSYFKGNCAEALELWQIASDGFETYVQQLKFEDLDAPLHYTRLNGESYTQPVYKVLAHVFNHSTYHRGQLVTQLRQLGFEDITSTDLTTFYNLNF